ncbi:MAG: CRTAC1 family protein [Sedimentisphaerales bacterium]|nr:CRTAC1 family protein [Sedimentisphaerales bacterium]
MNNTKNSISICSSVPETTASHPVVSPVLVVCAAALALLGMGRLLHAESPCPIRLTDVTGQTGITFRHTDGSSGQRYIVESVTAGLLLFDYDGDNDVDIYFINGAPLKGMVAKIPPANALYRNNSDGTFTDVTGRAGVGDTGYGLGVTAGDYDNDGDPDIYVNNYGPNVLYRNNADGTFTDVTEQAGVANGSKVGAAVFFLDMDKDADLDLFVANYLDFTYENHLMRTEKGFPKYAGPMDFPPTPNALFRNNGDGTFTDVSEASGVAAHKGWGMGGVSADYDGDGDTDVFVANDVSANFLFQNDGTGHFQEVALFAGLAYDVNGDEHGSMGIDCGDYNNDGRLDFYETSYAEEYATLYKNLGDGLFEDVTFVTGAGAGTYPYVTWGASLVDLDNDGDRDIFVACGDLQDNVELYNTTRKTNPPNLVLLHVANDTFVDVSAQCGDGLRIERRSRGAGFDDLDNDGDVDIVILNARSEPTILRNDAPAKGNWLQVRLCGTRTNRDGIGARVKVTAGDLVQWDEVHGGRGYQSHYGSRLHFGLGPRQTIDRVEVRWIGGGTDTYTNLKVNQDVLLIEGGGIQVR